MAYLILIDAEQKIINKKMQYDFYAVKDKLKKQPFGKKR